MYVRVRVTASSRKEIVARKSNDHFNISVKEPASQNQANKRVLELIAEEFGVNIKNVRMISGHHSPGKILDIKTKP